MQIEIKTLGAGTFDGELPGYATIGDIAKDVALATHGWIILLTKTGDVLINKTNIVSIRKKR